MHISQLDRQVSDLGAPAQLESRVKHNGTAEKYGMQAAKAMYVSEGMAMLGREMALLEEMQAELENPDSNMLKSATKRYVERQQQAKELFMASADKIFTKPDVSDPKGS